MDMHARLVGGEAEMATCDGARLAWFPRPPVPSPTPEEIADALGIRADAAGGDWPRGEAVEVAYLIECYSGWPMVEGFALSADGAPVRPHAWNVLPCGAVLDACADLHGGPGHPGVSAAATPGWRQYRREWTADYNPGAAARYPELAGCAWSGIPDMDALGPARGLGRAPGA